MQNRGLFMADVSGMCMPYVSAEETKMLQCGCLSGARVLDLAQTAEYGTSQYRNYSTERHSIVPYSTVQYRTVQYKTPVGLNSVVDTAISKQ